MEPSELIIQRIFDEEQHAETLRLRSEAYGHHQVIAGPILARHNTAERCGVPLARVVEVVGGRATCPQDYWGKPEWL